MPRQRPSFVVHSLAHAAAVLGVAAEARCAVTLLSAPDAGIYAGAGWFKAVIDAARRASPAARCTAIIDCGDDAGAAQAAIRAGIEGVIFAGRSDVAERLAHIANCHGARVLTERPTATVDLGPLLFADPASLLRHCADHLASLRPIC